MIPRAKRFVFVCLLTVFVHYANAQPPTTVITNGQTQTRGMTNGNCLAK